jgi:hypothetical protein
MELEKTNGLQILINEKVRIVEMVNKPAFAVSLENLKIKEYPEEIRNMNTAKLVDWCLNLLGVNGKDGIEEHHAVAFEFINNSLINYTYQEIKAALMMFVAGDFNGVFIAQQFNSVVLGKIMKNYAERRDDMLRGYYQKRRAQFTIPQNNPITKKQNHEAAIRMMEQAYKDYTKSGKILSGFSFLYGWLLNADIISPTEQERKDAYENAKPIAAEKAKMLETSTAKNLLKQIDSQQSSDVVIIEAKKLLIIKYFRNLQTKYHKLGSKDIKRSIINHIKAL